MKAFANLFEELDQTTSTNEKIHAMVEFFKLQDADTSAWALYFLTGRKPKQLISSLKLRTWAQQELQLPAWLLDECYGAVGDTAEMIALLLGGRGNAMSTELSLGEWMNNHILPLAHEDESTKKKFIVQWWSQLSVIEIFILNKLLTGAFRVGVSETLVFRALEKLTALPRSTIASSLLGVWSPSAEFFENLKSNRVSSMHSLLPKPFCLAAPINGEIEALGEILKWQIEWKWDGIRCQIVKAGNQIEIWSRGEERVTHSFPDLSQKFLKIPGSWILDGEVLAGTCKSLRSFQDLQKRLNRKKPTATLMEQIPISFLAYDLLQCGKENFTNRPLVARRKNLENLIQPFLSDFIGLSPILKINDWQKLCHLRQEARSHHAEGFILKRKDAGYEVGRKRNIWFKWKVDPLTIDVVLTAAQPGTGRRASLYTDYTFSIWRGKDLVPIAKAYSGLTDQEIRTLDSWIRKNTLDRFGPVRSLKPEKVFELGFEGIGPSPRHKSGFALRFPRILRERIDKKSEDADTVENIQNLIGNLHSPLNKPQVLSEKNQATQLKFNFNESA